MALADFLEALAGDFMSAPFLAGAFAVVLVAVFAGALAADFFTGTELFLVAAAVFATGLVGAFFVQASVRARSTQLLRPRVALRQVPKER